MLCEAEALGKSRSSTRSPDPGGELVLPSLTEEGPDESNWLPTVQRLAIVKKRVPRSERTLLWA